MIKARALFRHVGTREEKNLRLNFFLNFLNVLNLIPLFMATVFNFVCHIYTFVVREKNGNANQKKIVMKKQQKVQ